LRCLWNFNLYIGLIIFHKVVVRIIRFRFISALKPIKLPSHVITKLIEGSSDEMTIWFYIKQIFEARSESAKYQARLSGKIRWRNQFFWYMDSTHEPSLHKYIQWCDLDKSTHCERSW
jgi:hypothetical protein